MNPEKSEAYTIDDIARELGVSKTTVSRAISGKGRISEETRKKVFALMEERNYRPSAAAKSLANNKTYNLALVLPEDCNTDEMPFFQHCLTGACAVASQSDYDILITTVSGDNLRQLQRVLSNRKVDGVILTRSVSGSRVVPLLKEKGMPFVLIGTTQDNEVLWVDHDSGKASFELTSLLITMGLRKLCLLSGDLSYQVNQRRLQGFQDACTKYGIDTGKNRVFERAEEPFFLQKAVDTCLEQGVDCILCMDDFICRQTMARLREKGISVPEQVCVASFYDSSFLQHSTPPVTSLQFDPKRLGMEACQALLNRLEGKPVESRMFPEYNIALRASTKRY